MKPDDRVWVILKLRWLEHDFKVLRIENIHQYVSEISQKLHREVHGRTDARADGRTD